jgi:hypothetical protein
LVVGLPVPPISVSSIVLVDCAVVIRMTLLSSLFEIADMVERVTKSLALSAAPLALPVVALKLTLPPLPELLSKKAILSTLSV